jgi:hypothetical protein
VRGRLDLAESGVHATVSALIPSAPYHIGYFTCFADGDTWEAFNRLEYAVPDLADGNTLFDDYLPDDESAWRVHASRVSASGRDVLRDAERVRDISRQQTVSMIDDWLARGVLCPAPEAERWCFTWPAASLAAQNAKRLEKTAPPAGFLVSKRHGAA